MAANKSQETQSASTSTATAEKEIYIGAVIELNEKRVNLVPETPINQIEKRGLKLSLDKPLELGTFGNAMGSICRDLGVKNESLTKGEFPKTDVEFLDNVAKKVAKANMRIEALSYEKPPAKYKDEEKKELAPEQDPSKYVFVASVNWEDEQNNEPEKNESKDFFKLRGLIVGISSGYTNTDGENPEVQKAFKSALQAIPAIAPSSEGSPKQLTPATEEEPAGKKTK